MSLKIALNFSELNAGLAGNMLDGTTKHESREKLPEFLQGCSGD